MQKCLMLQQFLVAGNETTTKLLTNLIQTAVDSELEDRLRSNPDLIDNFIEEGLRYEAPVGGLFRMAKEDTEVNNVEIKSGDHLWVIYAGGLIEIQRYLMIPMISLLIERTQESTWLSVMVNTLHRGFYLLGRKHVSLFNCS